MREADRATQLLHLLSSPQQGTDKLKIEDGFRQFGRENRSDFFFFLRGSEHYSLDFKKLEALNSCQSIKNVKRLFTEAIHQTAPWNHNKRKKVSKDRILKNEC